MMLLHSIYPPQSKTEREAQSRQNYRSGDEEALSYGASFSFMRHSERYKNFSVRTKLTATSLTNERPLSLIDRSSAAMRKD